MELMRANQGLWQSRDVHALRSAASPEFRPLRRESEYRRLHSEYTHIRTTPTLPFGFFSRLLTVPVLEIQAAGLFDAIGSTGFIIVQQVFLADATNLVNRALWSTLPESITTIPALYLGTIVGEGFLNTTWRWGYGSWAIITPVVAVPLIATVLILQLRAKKHGLQVKTLSAVAGCSPDAPMWKKIFHLVWTEMDMLGLLLLVTGMALILIPLSLTGSFSPQRWKEASFIAMIVIGVVCLITFLVWDLKFAKQPYIPRRMANRTVIAGCAIQVLDFWGYTLFTIFFPSYLQVAGEYSPGHATRIE